MLSQNVNMRSDLRDATAIEFHHSTSTIREEEDEAMYHVVCNRTAVQGIKQNISSFKTSIIPHFFVDIRKGCVDSVFREKNGSSRLQMYSSRSLEFLAIKLLAPWRSLTFVYPHSSHNLEPSDFDGSPYVRCNEPLVIS